VRIIHSAGLVPSRRKFGNTLRRAFNLTSHIVFQRSRTNSVLSHNAYMPKSRLITILQLLMPSALLCFAMGAPAQLKSENSPLEHTEQTSIPITTKWTSEAAGAVQQVEINSVVLLICPFTQTKGSGFLIDTGLIVTNNHVLNGCTAGQMQCITSQGSTISFTKAVVDKRCRSCIVEAISSDDRRAALGLSRQAESRSQRVYLGIPSRV
jgi:S1-C subfamily serine protease